MLLGSIDISDASHGDFFINDGPAVDGECGESDRRAMQSARMKNQLSAYHPERWRTGIFIYLRDYRQRGQNKRRIHAAFAVFIPNIRDDPDAYVSERAVVKFPFANVPVCREIRESKR
jgi:hypothetical protein